MKNLKEFCNLYPVQKTLRFRLEPIGRTAEFVERDQILENDERRANEYEKVKDMIDLYHRAFIDSVLDNFRFEDSSGHNLLEDFKRVYLSKSETREEELKRIQALLRSAIVKSFKADSRFKNIDKKELIRDV